MKPLSLTLLVVALAAADPKDADFLPIPQPSAPPVALAAVRNAQGLTVAVEVAHDAAGAAVEVGCAATKSVRLAVGEAKTVAVNGGSRFIFTIPAARLVGGPDDWRRLRLAFTVGWKGGPGGAERQRERFLHTGGAAHAGLDQDTTRWLPFDLDEHGRQVADRALRLVVPLRQPMDGKATVVIENGKGQRIRNLIGGEARTAGSHEIPWDGCDDDGRPVPPGDYRWRSLHHPGLRPVHLMSFGDGPGTNHTTCQSVTTNGRQVALAAPVAEGGHGLVLLDGDGTFVRGWNFAHGMGLNRTDVAMDDRFIYAAHDGYAWGQHIDRKKKDWSVTYSLTIERFAIDGKNQDWPDRKHFQTVATVTVGPGSPQKLPDRISLNGMACAGGRLYISDRNAEAVLVVEAASGRVITTLPLPAAGPLAAAPDGSLVAVSGKALVRIDAGNGKAKPLAMPADADPQGVTVAADGTILVADGTLHRVRVLAADGRQQRLLGSEAAGPYAGPYVPERLIHPAGLAVGPGNRLWVCERERWTPKRITALDLASGKARHTTFGPTHYGASGGGIDPGDGSRWIGMDTLWKVDTAARTAVPVTVMNAEPRTLVHWRMVHHAGRIYAIGLSGSTVVCEVTAAGTFKRVAEAGEAHRYCFTRGWNPEPAFIAAFERDYPDRKGRHADKGPGFLWVDASGDGAMQAEEIRFTRDAAESLNGGYWGSEPWDLTLRFIARVDRKPAIVVLKPRGILANGAPDYGDLVEACRAATPIALASAPAETASDARGRLVVNSDPVMTCWNTDGSLAWRHPNRWTNVHGSHNAPLPRAGEMQGVLFCVGSAPLDGDGEVMAWMGNHGRMFFLTSDGMYLDEAFRDVRVAATRDVLTIGGEPFGGTFAKVADGRWLLQAGGNEYRIFRVDGLDQVARAAGTITVTPAQVAAAERARSRLAAATAAAKEVVVPRLATAPGIDGDDRDWPGPPPVTWDQRGQFKAVARLGWDDNHLHLFWRIQDPTPWRNGGADWQTLFKTGDSVDMQIGTDEQANPARTGPVPGDLRLLIAPFKGKPVAVLYRHRCPGAKDGVRFQSPWRSEQVDSVRLVDEARIVVRTGGDGYTVEASIPLATLGIARPAGRRLRLDVGTLFGDGEGTVTGLRSYWANRNTMLVNDVPGEIMLTPNMWGMARFAGDQP